MKRFISRLPKKGLFAVALIAATFGIAAGVKAYYPDRPTYTTAHPADHVTFDSITDNPTEGDERAFFSVKDAANTGANGFLHQTTVKDGETVLLRMYVHNNAASNLNGTNFDGKGVAKNTKVRVWLPSVTDSTMRANAYITADNATPQEVSDTADFVAPTTANKFSLSYVPGSAVAYNNFAGAAGLKLNDSIVSSGALIGEKTANGIVPGCFDYVNIVTLKVKVHMQTPSFTVTKSVALPGDKNWSKSVTAQPGQTVKYDIAFKNTGNTTINNVVIRDQLPKNVTIVSGSTKLFNTNFPNGTPGGSDAVVSNGGLGIGAYTAGANAFVDFEAKMPSADQLACGVNTLTNIGQAMANNQDVTDTAIVTINKQCTPPPSQTPVYSCDLLTLSQDKNDSHKVTASVTYTATGGANLKMVTYNFGDDTQNAKITTDKTTQGYTYQTEGTFPVTATLTFNVNGKDVTGVTSDKCAASVLVTTTPPPTTPPVSQLPKTGAGNAIGIFAAVVTASTIGYRLFLSRKLARR